MLNADSYFDNFNYAPIVERVLSENKVEHDDNHYGRHMQEIKKKIEEIRRTYKSRDYFKEMPTMDNDFSSYVIVTNMPFVEEEKRDKFKVYMSKKVGDDLASKIQDYIFPYSNDDKDYFNNNSLLIIKFETFEEAKLAAIALNGFQIDKSHKVNAITYIDFDRIIGMEDVYTPPKHFSFADLVQWEESNLIEMVMCKSADRVVIGKIHYLKKEFTPIYNINIRNALDVVWSPQGKYLSVNEGNVNYIFNILC
jgi:hypothetical protein